MSMANVIFVLDPVDAGEVQFLGQIKMGGNDNREIINRAINTPDGAELNRRSNHIIIEKLADENQNSKR